MSLKLEDAVPPPHLFSGRSATWPSSYTSHTRSLGSSPAIKSPKPPHTYSRVQDRPMSSHNIPNLPTTGWYNPSIAAADFQYTDYENYNAPRCSVGLAPATPPTLSQAGQVPSSIVHADLSSRVISPVPIYPHIPLLIESTQHPIELPQTSDLTPRSSPTHVQGTSHGQELPHSSLPVLRPVPSTPSWAVDSLGIHTPSDSYYANFTQHFRAGESKMEMTQPTPQSRLEFTPIAPHPVETPRSTAAKRSREEDENAEMPKKRRRSKSSSSTQLEFTEEDKLLLKLKEDNTMPWKDIAARFQSEMGRQYQIPALQMRHKRLRERMRTWNEVDVSALRMAHEYWAQNKWDVIAQKMLDFGTQEKWTARQCARKWAEFNALPTPLPQLDQQAQHSLTPFSVSPEESLEAFMPHMQL